MTESVASRGIVRDVLAVVTDGRRRGGVVGVVDGKHYPTAHLVLDAANGVLEAVKDRRRRAATGDVGGRCLHPAVHVAFEATGCVDDSDFLAALKVRRRLAATSGVSGGCHRLGARVALFVASHINSYEPRPGASLGRDCFRGSGGGGAVIGSACLVVVAEEARIGFTGQLHGIS